MTKAQELKRLWEKEIDPEWEAEAYDFHVIGYSDGACEAIAFVCRNAVQLIEELESELKRVREAAATALACSVPKEQLAAKDREIAGLKAEMERRAENAANLEREHGEVLDTLRARIAEGERENRALREAAQDHIDDALGREM